MSLLLLLYSIQLDMNLEIKPKNELGDILDGFNTIYAVRLPLSTSRARRSAPIASAKCLLATRSIQRGQLGEY